jgi:hypothetical protein
MSGALLAAGEAVMTKFLAVIVILWLTSLGLSPSAQAQAENQVGLLVLHGDGQVVTRCVAFSESQLSGYEVLQRSGLDLNIEVSGMGAAICRIDGEGCTFPQQSCFCGTEGDAYIYWSYWRQADGAWQYSSLGASNSLVQPGSVEGWVWGAGSVNSANPPPPITFAEICTPPPATPTATASPSASPTVTSIPSPTPTSTATPVPPLETPTFTPTLPPIPPTLLPTATATPLPTLTGTPTPLPATATPALPQIVLFTTDHATIRAGETAKLLWQVEGAAEVLLRDAAGEQSLGRVGNLVVTPQQTTLYTLVARNPASEVAATVTITVNAAAVAQPLQPPPPAPTDTPPTPAVVAAVHEVPTPTQTPPVVSVLPTGPNIVSATASITAPIANSVTTTTTAPITTVALPLTATAPGVAMAALPITPVAAPSLQPVGGQLLSQQPLLLLGAVALVIIVPLALFCIIGLIWLTRSAS